MCCFIAQETFPNCGAEAENTCMENHLLAFCGNDRCLELDQHRWPTLVTLSSKYKSVKE